MSNINPLATRPVTRAKNVDQHPGHVFQTRKRRTREEIDRDNALIQEANAAKKRKKNEGIARIAQLEDKMAVDDASAGSAHPRSHHAIDEPTDGNAPPHLGPSRKRVPRMEGASRVGNARSMGSKRRQPEAQADEALISDNLSLPGAANSGLEVEEVVNLMTPINKRGRKAGPKVSKRYPEEQQAIEMADPELHGHRKNVETVTKPAQVVQESDDESAELDPTPKKKGKALTRSHAIANIAAAAQDGGSESEQHVSASEYELQVGSDMGFDLDDDPTPKKKEKTTKIPVRQAVEASRQKPESHRENEEVCDQTTTATKTTKTTYGPIATWATQVAQAKPKHPNAAGSTTRTVSSTTAVSASRTTGSSTAVVIPVKNNVLSSGRAKSGRIDDDAAVAGFFEEDEAEEREAALSSPVKGRQRLTSKAIVKFEHSASIPKRPGGRKEKFTNSNLPEGSQQDGVWRRTFVPTYLHYLGSRNVQDAWAITDDNAVSIMQQIWDYTYGARVPHTIVTTGAVFFIVDQRACEWRSGFGSTAIAIIQAFFDDNEINADDERKEVATSALNNYNFLYRDVHENNHETKRKGIFGGSLIVQTLAGHYNAAHGAVSVPSIGDLDKPFVALALSAAAVERALTLWRDGFISCATVAAHKDKKRSSAIMKTVNVVTGKESTKSTDFNQANWGAITNGYLSSIKKNLANNGKFDRIITDAMGFAKVNRRGDSALSSPEHDLSDERACLCDDDSD